MSAYPTLALVSLGALSTQWTPPGSCVSTTTVWGNSFFVGFQSALGLDSGCIPTPTAGSQTATPQFTTDSSGSTAFPIAWITPAPISTSTSSATSTPNFFPSGYRISSVAYYSPGICPSGFTYAASFTAGRPRATALEERYLCCPSGLEASTSISKSRRTSDGRVHTSHIVTYEYPLCTQSTRTISNLWSMTPGWPTSQPSTFDVGTSTTSGAFFYVTASGLVVGWRPSDTAIVDFLEKNNISLPPFPEPLPETDTAVRSRGLHPGAVAGLIIANIIIFISIACCCWSRGSKKRPSITLPSFHRPAFTRLQGDDDRNSATGLTGHTNTPYAPYAVLQPSATPTEPHGRPHNLDVELANFNSQLSPPAGGSAQGPSSPAFPEPARRDADGVFAEAPPRYEEAVKAPNHPPAG